MIVFCTTCNAFHQHSARRGSKLSDVICRQCRGPLRKSSREEMVANGLDSDAYWNLSGNGLVPKDFNFQATPSRIHVG